MHHTQLLKKTLYTILLCVSTAPCVFSQTLAEKTSIRFYEHHSSDVTNMPFGNGADGSKSGYDFVNNTYFYSFNEATFDAYTNGEEANIDMVEHNGPFGTNDASMHLGFTSGVSTIWGGSIKGNSTTKWMKAPANFNYASATTVTDIMNAYNDDNATVDVAAVNNNDVYLGRIRGRNIYVALRCYNIHALSAPPSGQNANVYFDFDYKYGAISTGIAKVKEDVLSVYPNPATDVIVITLTNAETINTVKLYSATGAEVILPNTILPTGKLDVSSLSAGVYFLHATTSTGATLIKQFIKQPTN
jgi:hypothetical protein